LSTFGSVQVSWDALSPPPHRADRFPLSDPQRQLRDKGLIYKSSYAGWYAVSDEAYYPAAQVGEVVVENSGEKYMVSLGRFALIRLKKLS